jgi:N-acetylneuraminic acid mutarotase
MAWHGTGDSSGFIRVRHDREWGRVLRARWRAMVLCALALFLAWPSVGATRAAAIPGWQSAGTLPAQFSYPNAVLLADGRVLTVSEKVAAVYTMTTDSWVATGVLPDDARAAQLIGLANGGALLAGGAPDNFHNNPFAPTQQVMLFNPATSTWKQGTSMKFGRASHTLTTLASGQILAVGGDVGGLSPRQPVRTVKEVERYDSATDTWTTVAPLLQARFAHTATRLADGRVLVAGGAVSKEVNQENGGSDNLSSVEVYNPATDSWQLAAPMSVTRVGHTATLLQDGTVLVVGGNPGASMTAELYDPVKNSWASAGTLGPNTRDFSATLLLGGEVLVAGGSVSSNTATASAAYYIPGTKIWQALSSLSAPRTNHAAVLVNGQVVVIGGTEPANKTSAERYNVTPPGIVCQEETGHCLRGAFLTYWQQHGQLPINGYALSDPFPEQLEDGKVYLVQYFERVRMEAHPENAAPNDVLLGQFGRRIHPVDPAVMQQAGATYFPPTGHNVSGGFLAYWQANGGVPQFGYPLSEVIQEKLEDGNTYQVQYFERARFEYHPENADQNFQVLLGQFGRRILAGR